MRRLRHPPPIPCSHRRGQEGEGEPIPRVSGGHAPRAVAQQLLNGPLLAPAVHQLLRGEMAARVEYCRGRLNAGLAPQDLREADAGVVAAPWVGCWWCWLGEQEAIRLCQSPRQEPLTHQCIRQGDLSCAAVTFQPPVFAGLDENNRNPGDFGQVLTLQAAGRRAPPAGSRGPGRGGRPSDPTGGPAARG